MTKQPSYLLESISITDDYYDYDKAKSLSEKINTQHNFFFKENYTPTLEDLYTVLVAIDILLNTNSLLGKTSRSYRVLSYLNYLMYSIKKNKLSVDDSIFFMIEKTLRNIFNVVDDQWQPDKIFSQVILQWANCVSFLSELQASRNLDIDRHHIQREIGTLISICTANAEKIIGKKSWQDAIDNLLTVLYSNVESQSIGLVKQSKKIIDNLATSPLVYWHDKDGKGIPFIIYYVFTFYITYFWRKDKNKDHFFPYLERDLILILNKAKELSSNNVDDNFSLLVSAYLKNTYLARIAPEQVDNIKKGPFADFYRDLPSGFDFKTLFSFQHPLPNLKDITLFSQSMMSEMKIINIEKKIKNVEDLFYQEMGITKPVSNNQSNLLKIFFIPDWDVFPFFANYSTASITEIGSYEGCYYKGYSYIFLVEKRTLEKNTHPYLNENAAYDCTLTHEMIHYFIDKNNLINKDIDYSEVEWWAEGLCEYFSTLNISHCLLPAETFITKNRPSLSDIIDNIGDNIFKEKFRNRFQSWAYTVYLYLNEARNKNKWLEIAKALREPDVDKAMHDYRIIIDELKISCEQDYQDWMKQRFPLPIH